MADAVVAVERFEADSEHGRPKIATFRGRAGRIAVHYERSSAALWLFFEGPAGGDRGSLALAPRRAALVLEWLDGDRTRVLPGNGGWMVVRDGLMTFRKSSGRGRSWRMSFDTVSLAAFDSCLREWAKTVIE